MKFDPFLSDDGVMAELGRRLTQARLAQSMTQAQLAQAAGVSKRTVERLEDGTSVQLANFIRCLRALNKIDGLDRLLPPTPVNPLDLLKSGGEARVRARATGVEAPGRPWTWGDEP